MASRLLFIGMWNFADDLGHLPHSPKSIKAQVFPGDDVSPEAVARMIDELSSNGLLARYSVEGKEYLEITGWDHQKIDRPQKPKHPSPVEYSSNDRRTIATDRIGEEGRGEDNSEAKASDAGASADPRKRLFDEGLPKLAKLTGKGPDACRSFVGKCLKEAGDDAVIVLGLIEDAERNQVVDPSAWIATRLKAKPVASTIVRPDEVDWDMVLKLYKTTGHWSKWAGPTLDSPACRAPPELLTKYGLTLQ